MISTPQFSKMKPSVVIINTARGAVIDEAALVKALSDGKVFSAGLDVYEEEPKIHQGLIDNPHVLLLPHMGTWTVETQIKMEVSLPLRLVFKRGYAILSRAISHRKFAQDLADSDANDSFGILITSEVH